MFDFNSIKPTKKGTELELQAQLGKTLNFIKFKLGDGTISSENEIQNLTDLKNEKLSLNIISSEIRSDSEDASKKILTMAFSINPTQLTESFYFREMGIYAKDPDDETKEVLVLYANAGDNADYLDKDKMVFSDTIYVDISISGDAVISVTVDISSGVTLEEFQAAMEAQKEKNEKLQENIDTLKEENEQLQENMENISNASVYSEEGAFGIRVTQDGEIQVQNGSGEWEDVSNGGISENELFVPYDITNMSAVAGDTKITLNWSDPVDKILDGITVSKWNNTKVVMKPGSMPADAKDGTIIIDNTERDKYKINGFVVNNLTNDVTYYFRFFVYSTDNVVNANEDNVVNTTPQSIPPDNVSDLKLKAGNGKVTVSWGDPGDKIVEGETVSVWEGTKLVYKAGSYPTDVNDGTIAVDNKVLNQYKTTGFEITGLTNGVTYYFQAFPYSELESVNSNAANRVNGTPQAYRTMTVVIDLSNSNPATCVTYADDAIEMTAGSNDWDDFFGHYPCLFKNGVEAGKLNPNNFAQFEDGSAADITSGNAGDVMIAFPRHGLKISTANNKVTISMTDDPNNPDFEYMAHQRGTTPKDVFYLGAYKGFKDTSNKLRSLSGKTITANQTIGTFRTQAKANGSGYDQSGFYQLTYRQAMYVLKYKNLDSQTAVGRGFVDGNSAATTTGNTNTKGMDYGETTGKVQMKLFGLEDFWGNVYEFIDGLYSDASRNILTATDNFNDTGSGYTNQGKGATSDIGNYMSKPQGGTHTGFIAKEVSGSETTYFCDSASLVASRLACFGGTWNIASSAGAFHLSVYRSASDSSAYYAARLMYL